MVCRILVPQPRIEPSPLCVRLWGPNHWTTREFPLVVLLDTGSVVPREGAGQMHSSVWTVPGSADSILTSRREAGPGTFLIDRGELGADLCR